MALLGKVNAPRRSPGSLLPSREDKAPSLLEGWRSTAPMEFKRSALAKGWGVLRGPEIWRGSQLEEPLPTIRHLNAVKARSPARGRARACSTPRPGPVPPLLPAPRLACPAPPRLACPAPPCPAPPAPPALGPNERFARVHDSVTSVGSRKP